MASYKPVTALMRGVEVLEAISRLKEATVSGIARATGLTTPTVVRILITLEAAGYVLKDNKRGRYLLSGRVLELSGGFTAHSEIAAVAGGIMPLLRERLVWPSDVGVFDTDAMVIAETSRVEGQFFHNRKPGYRSPVFGTSLGLAFIAYCDEKSRKQAVAAASRLPERWNDLAREPGLLAEAIAAIRARGYAVMPDAYSEQAYGNRIWAVAVPVLLGETAVASINVSMVREAAARSEPEESCLLAIRWAAEQISHTLRKRRGYPPGEP